MLKLALFVYVTINTKAEKGKQQQNFVTRMQEVISNEVEI